MIQVQNHGRSHFFSLLCSGKNTENSTNLVMKINFEFFCLSRRPNRRQKLSCHLQYWPIQPVKTQIPRQNYNIRCDSMISVPYPKAWACGILVYAGQRERCRGKEEQPRWKQRMGSRQGQGCQWWPMLKRRTPQSLAAMSQIDSVTK